MITFNKLLRAGEGKKLRKYQTILKEINNAEPTYQAMSDEQLREQTLKLKNELSNGATQDSLLVPAFALVREAAFRVLSQRHYDVQVLGALALYYGNIAEMKTGEGKTLVSTMPAFLKALSGEPVHVVTVNDYLAQRDSEWMGQVHRFLGLSVGCLSPEYDSAQRKEQYAKDILYGTNTEFGFDYLRDNMVTDKNNKVARGYHYAIIDEVDSILIDEARTPLIISGLAEKSNEIYQTFAVLAKQLIAEVDYEVDLKKQTIAVNLSGENKVEQALKIDNLYSPDHSFYLAYLFASLKAKEFFHLDREYIVTNNQVMIVDEHTGRVLDGRRYSDGLHQAIEAKEKVEIKEEYQTLASITLQNFFRLYKQISGMTGTAMTEEAEFYQIYKLGVVPIPSNRVNQRNDANDVIYATLESKLQAILEDVKTTHATGQPILIGTTSVESSERVSKMLTINGLKHEVLNAKNHEREAHIIAKAGIFGALTVATNMAGRGTDIILGGNPEILAQELLSKEKAELPVAEYQLLLNSKIQEINLNKAQEISKVIESGGLYVLGTERSESRRIDNQLRGRAGRQGDPGKTRFYLSLEDEMMKRFAGGAGNLISNVISSSEGPIEIKMITNAIKRAQAQAESLNFEMRKEILKYDDVMNLQRKLIYQTRNQLLEGEDVHPKIEAFISYHVKAALNQFTSNEFAENWNQVELAHTLSTLGLEELEQKPLLNLMEGDAETFSTKVNELVLEKYQHKFESYLSDGFDRAEQEILLNTIDKNWRHHLYEMDYLREGINLRANAQKDPLVEYKSEAFLAFELLEDAIKLETSTILLSIKQINTEVIKPVPPVALQYSSPTSLSSNVQSKNSLCTCGSGKKYKRCHGV